jgi:hypothetical protein
MNITEQRTIRLSSYYIKVLDQIQESLGLNFSDTIRHLITEHERQTRETQKTGSLLKQLSEKIDRIPVHAAPRSDQDGHGFSDQLNRIERNILVIKKALGIIGGSDPRTKAMIANLFMEDHEQN